MTVDVMISLAVILFPGRVRGVRRISALVAKPVRVIILAFACVVVDLVVIDENVRAEDFHLNRANHID